jgi:glycosyltransferase involved in cell wall biosynthesis
MLDIVCFTGNSGLTDYTVSLARELGKLTRVRVITADSIGSQFCSLNFYVKKIFRRSRHLPVDYWQLLFVLLRGGPRKIIFQSWLKFAFIDALIARFLALFGYELYVTVHDTLPHTPKWWSRRLLSFYYCSFRGLIAHSTISKSELMQMGVRSPIYVTPHGSYDLFNLSPVEKPTARRTLNLDQRPFMCLYFGHIEPRKGCFEFLQCAALGAKNEGVLYVMAGRNDLTNSEKARLDSYRSLSNLVIRDQKIPFDQVQYYFRSADLVALPYLEGTTSGVMKLGVAFGVPIAATAVGDMADAIRNKVAIEICNGPNGIASALCALTENLSQSENSIHHYKNAILEEQLRTSWHVVIQPYLEMLDIPESIEKKGT